MTVIPSKSPGSGHELQPSADPFNWLPIRSLGPRHRPRIQVHLQKLDGGDRYLRFGYAAGDAQIQRYVDQLDFERDEVFGVFNRRLDIVALAHLAYLGQNLDLPSSAEFGVSVLKRARGRGIGARLFERACLHARNRSIDTLLVHALTENTAMLRIAQHAGARIERQGPDATALLRLPADDWSSHLTQMVETQAGELDYGFKLQARRVDRAIKAVRGLVADGAD